MLNSKASIVQTEAPAPPSRRIKEIEVMVADVTEDTPEALDRFTAFLENPKGSPNRAGVLDVFGADDFSNLAGAEKL